ncbi:MAG: hypothetical protein K4304_00420 [Propionicimonas sp.]
MTAPSIPWPRAIIALGILAISATVATLTYAVIIATGGNDHQTADWLISYPGEFIRRGLFGQLLLGIAPYGAGALWLLFAIQIACYVPVFAFFVSYLVRTNFSWSAIALVVSPAALPFIGWDPLGGFRKEILGFLALVLIAFARRRIAQHWQVTLLVAALAVWTLGVFSWESVAFMLPAVGFLLLTEPQLPLRRTMAALFTAVGASALAASVLWHGTAATSTALCTRILDQGLGPNLCTGAVAWMGRSLQDSLDLIDKDAATNSGYLVMLALALLPIALSPWLRRFWGWALVAAIGIAPLFALGIDYGRWVHILVIELSICIAVSHRDLIESRLWNPLSVGLFVTMWALPHANPTTPGVPGWPWKGLAADVINWLQVRLLSLR